MLRRLIYVAFLVLLTAFCIFVDYGFWLSVKFHGWPWTPGITNFGERDFTRWDAVELLFYASLNIVCVVLLWRYWRTRRAA